jgi:ADP-ribose pyrophosphatase
MRELSEETGYGANNVVPMGELYTTPALIDEVIYMYIATDLYQGEQHPDEDEFVDVVKIPLTKAVEMVMNGEIRDSKTQVMILKADKYFNK